MSDQLTRLVKKYDPVLNKADSFNYKLFLQLSSNGLSFTIFDEKLNKFLSIEDISFENINHEAGIDSYITNLVGESEWLTLSYQSVHIIYECNKSTLVPAPLFAENEKMTFSEFNFELSKDAHLHQQKLTNLDAFMLYEVPESILESVNSLFPSHRLMPHTAVLIENLLIMNKNLPSQKKFFVNLRHSSMDVLIIDKRKLIYSNSFEYKSKEDFIYFVVFVLEQIQINPEEIELVLSGKIDKNSELFEILYKYVRNIRFQGLPEGYSYSYIFNEIPVHYYFNLLSTVLCE